MNHKRACKVLRSLLLLVLMGCRWSAAQDHADQAVSVETLKGLAEKTFATYTAQQGMPHESLFTVTQDATGFLWVGSFGGLARFDGYHFHVYRHSEGQAGTLPDNTVRAIQRRSEGGLWIGTGTAGLAVYNPLSDSFFVPENEPAPLRRAHVFAIEDDRAGGIWVTHSNGLSHYNASTHRFEDFSGQHPAAGLPAGQYFAAHVLRSGDVLAGGDGLFLRRAGQSAWSRVRFGGGPGDIGEEQAVWAIFESQDGEVWVGTDVNGLGHLDRTTMTVHGVPHLSGRDNLFGQNTVRSFVESSPGDLWLGSYGGGLVEWNRHTGAMHVWKYDPTATAPLCNNFVRSLFLDREGILWVATNAGLSATSLQPHQIFSVFSSPLKAHGLFGTEVRALGSGYGWVWVGFDDGGLAAIAPDGQVHRVTPEAGTAKDQVSGREVLALRPIDSRTVAAGGSGLFLIDTASLTYHKLDLPELRSQVLKNMVVSGRDLWLATYDGLFRYNLDSHQMQSFQHRAGDPNSLIDNYVLDLLVRPDGKLWIGTRLGLELLDPQTGVFHHFFHVSGDSTSLANSNVQSLAFDSHGRLWVGTVNGGAAILINGSETKPVFRALKLNSGQSTPVILAIAQGLDGHMWINTPIGLISTDADGNDVQLYGPEDGLQINGQNLYSSARLQDGTIVFPGHSYLSVVDPRRSPPEQLRGPLMVTDLTVSGDHGASYVPAQRVLRDGIQLRSHDGFDASFADLDYGASSRLQYSYKLEGFDTGWKDFVAGQRAAVYTNLPSGSYHLLLRASREDIDSPVEAAVPVEVQARLYERAWFRVLSLALVVLAILSAIRLRTAVLTRRQALLEEKIDQRTADLLQSEEHLREANSKLIQLATQDYLTGVLNRRGFLDRLQLELARCRRLQEPFCVAILDLDHFKHLNDTHGHEIGDMALKTIAQAVQRNLRETDLLGRWGGEEFILFFPCTDEQTGGLLAERLRVLIGTLLIERSDLKLTVTASIGLAASGHAASFEETLRQADNRLYMAKRAGRNRLQMAAV